MTFYKKKSIFGINRDPWRDQSSVQHKCDWGSQQSLSDIKIKSGNCLYHLGTQGLDTFPGIIIAGSAVALEINLVLLWLGKQTRLPR